MELLKDLINKFLNVTIAYDTEILVSVIEPFNLISSMDAQSIKKSKELIF